MSNVISIEEKKKEKLQKLIPEVEESLAEGNKAFDIDKYIEKAIKKAIDNVINKML
jgi:GTPase Era involved in 16S rRNA processing